MSYTLPENIQKILKNLSTKPGVYLHKDKFGAVNRAEYRAMIQSLMDFLSGKSDHITKLDFIHFKWCNT